MLFLLFGITLSYLLSTAFAIALPAAGPETNLPPATPGNSDDSSEPNDFANKAEIAGLFRDIDRQSPESIVIIINEYKGDELVRQSICQKYLHTRNVAGLTVRRCLYLFIPSFGGLLTFRNSIGFAIIEGCFENTYLLKWLTWTMWDTLPSVHSCG